MPVEKIALLGLAAAGLALLVRALPWPKSWRDRKPLSCATCMAFWSGLLVLLDHHYFHAGVIKDSEALAAIGLAAVLLHITGAFHAPPPLEELFNESREPEAIRQAARDSHGAG